MNHGVFQVSIPEGILSQYSKDIVNAYHIPGTGNTSVDKTLSPNFKELIV